MVREFKELQEETKRFFQHEEELLEEKHKQTLFRHEEIMKEIEEVRSSMDVQRKRG